MKAKTLQHHNACIFQYSWTTFSTCTNSGINVNILYNYVPILASKKVLTYNLQLHWNSHNTETSSTKCINSKFWCHTCRTFSNLCKQYHECITSFWPGHHEPKLHPLVLLLTFFCFSFFPHKWEYLHCISCFSTHVNPSISPGHSANQNTCLLIYCCVWTMNWKLILSRLHGGINPGHKDQSLFQHTHHVSFDTHQCNSYEYHTT